MSKVETTNNSQIGFTKCQWQILHGHYTIFLLSSFCSDFPRRHKKVWAEPESFIENVLFFFASKNPKENNLCSLIRWQLNCERKSLLLRARTTKKRVNVSDFAVMMSDNGRSNVEQNFFPFHSTIFWIFRFILISLPVELYLRLFCGILGRFHIAFDQFLSHWMWGIRVKWDKSTIRSKGRKIGDLEDEKKRISCMEVNSFALSSNAGSSGVNSDESNNWQSNINLTHWDECECLPTACRWCWMIKPKLTSNSAVDDIRHWHVNYSYSFRWIWEHWASMSALSSISFNFIQQQRQKNLPNPLYSLLLIAQNPNQCNRSMKLSWWITVWWKVSQMRKFLKLLLFSLFPIVWKAIYAPLC